MKKIRQRILHQGKFLSLLEATFIGNDGKEFVWESICRRKRRDIVVIVAKFHPSGDYLLIRQFRPAVDKVVLGFPAGIVDCADIKKQALQELKEETGYIGKIIRLGPPVKLSAALVDEDVYVVFARLDEKNKTNISPKQDLEPEEEIEVVRVKAKNLSSFVAKEAKRGVLISAAVYYFLAGKSF